MENQNEPSQTSSQSTIPQPSNLPFQPSSENKSHSSFLTNKLFLITIIIFILFTLVYAGIYLSLNSKLNQITKSNPTPTALPSVSPAASDTVGANWKMYVRRSYQFAPISSPRGDSIYSKYDWSVKYPSDWTIREHGVETFFLPSGVSEIYWASTSISISVGDKTDFRSPFISSYKVIKSIQNVPDKVDILQKNESGQRDSEYDPLYMATFTKGNYRVTSDFSYAVDKKYESIFEQMLQTLSIIEHQPVSTSLWKTFKDSRYNFTFQYPPDNIVKISSSSGQLTIGNALAEQFITIETYDTRARGISYCSGHVDSDKYRCELVHGTKTPIIIDWYSNMGHISSGPPIAEIRTNGDKSIIVFTLNAISPETKDIFRQILSTFQFTQ